ncbi:hypothetical protein [Actinoplanes sp. NPDC026619]|uniref:hypothetical protein n=1 Tax=Actinoplanes sp. NPDC026619 TaxID=3155798 RepID=UPI0033EF732C
MAIFLPCSILLWAGFVRSFMLGVSADSDGVVARLLLRTVKIRWAEIESISGSGGVGGAVGAAAAPAIAWKRSGKVRTTGLNVLGSYNLVRGKKKPLGERDAEDLNARLARWRKENALPRA